MDYYDVKNALAVLTLLVTVGLDTIINLAKSLSIN